MSSLDNHNSELPKALWPWDNQARLSLPVWLTAWLLLLVVTCLASAIFVVEHIPARIVLCGFLLSHTIVFGLGPVKTFHMRRGFVSLMHVICWTPGWVLCCLDAGGRAADPQYALWSYLLLGVIGVSLLFDLRDAWIYLRFVAAGRR